MKKKPNFLLRDILTCMFLFVCKKNLGRFFKHSTKFVFFWFLQKHAFIVSLMISPVILWQNVCFQMNLSWWLKTRKLTNSKHFTVKISHHFLKYNCLSSMMNTMALHHFSIILLFVKITAKWKYCEKIIPKPTYENVLGKVL